MFTTLWDKTCHLWEIACHLLKTAYRLVNFREIFKKCSAEIDGNNKNTDEILLDGKCLDDLKEEEALVDAVFAGDCERIVNLFNSGVSLEAKNLNRKLYHSCEHLLIPLHIATANKHEQCVQMLINYGADVNARDEFYCTALHLAAKADNYTCLIALLEAGADCNVPIIATSAYETQAPYCGGTTALHLAAAYNSMECVEELINFGADYNAVDANGHTSLSIAIKANYNECVITHIKKAHGCTILPSRYNEFRNTSLHLAVQKRMLDCVKELLRLGFSVNYLNEEGYTPLHLLCKGLLDYMRETDYEILKCLVLNGHNTDVNVRSANGFTALYYSVFESYNPDHIIFLFLNGADINIKEEVTDLTPLEYELKCKLSSVVLCYFVKRTPQVSRLKSLNVYPVCLSLSEHFDEEINILHASDLPENVGFNLIQGETDIFVEIVDRDEILNQIAEKSFLANTPVSKRVRYRLEQPVLGIVYERVQKEIKMLRGTFKKYTDSDIYDKKSEEDLDDIYRIFRSHLYTLKKQLWYETIASKPRSLQEYCRFSIRNSMAPMNLKYIEKLPLPKILKSFLLFENKKNTYKHIDFGEFSKKYHTFNFFLNRF